MLLRIYSGTVDEGEVVHLDPTHIIGAKKSVSGKYSYYYVITARSWFPLSESSYLEVVKLLESRKG